MPGKDPAFLWYSLNWLQKTASFMPDEKGVYADLLSHQHQDGSLPNDMRRLARMVGLSEEQFATIWSTIKVKFVDRSDNRLVDLELEQLMNERSTKKVTTDHTKAILARYAVLIRSAKKSAPNLIEKIKKEFKVSDFEQFSIEEASERLTDWFMKRITHHIPPDQPNGQPYGQQTRVENENKNKDENKTPEGGMGEDDRGGSPPAASGEFQHEPPWPDKPSPLPGLMVEIFVKAFPGYPRRDLEDRAAACQIAYEIGDLNGWDWEPVQNGRMQEILGEWQKIVDWTVQDGFYGSQSLSFICKHFQGLIQAKNNGKRTKKLTVVGRNSGNGTTNGLDPTEIERTGFGGPV